MPATTRSAAKQTHLEDFTDTSVTPGASKSKDININPRKRKSESKQNVAPPAKKPKESSTAKDTGDGAKDNPIVINRAPVLQLWGACVTKVVCPDLSWQTCLSAGNAISSLCAVSKGKAIGMIERKERDEDANKRSKKDTASLENIHVMGFPIPIKDGVAMMGKTKKTLAEGQLRYKYGNDAKYEGAKKTFQEALKKWKGEEDILQKNAFHMYEKFRPSVPKGQPGWGRKGHLDLEKAKAVIEAG